MLRDVTCSDFKLMDYSLLLGMEQRQERSSPHSAVTSEGSWTGNFVDLDDGRRIYIGIVDILQEFNFSKWQERLFKIWFRCNDPFGISSIEPVAYAERFWTRCILEKFQASDYQIQQNQPIYDGERESVTDKTSFSVERARESLYDYV